MSTDWQLDIYSSCAAEPRSRTVSVITVEPEVLSLSPADSTVVLDSGASVTVFWSTWRLLFEKLYHLSIFALNIFIQMEGQNLLPKIFFLFFIRAELLLSTLHVILHRWIQSRSVGFVPSKYMLLRSSLPVAFRWFAVECAAYLLNFNQIYYEYRLWGGGISTY